jgi:hypothetical protein
LTVGALPCFAVTARDGYERIAGSEGPRREFRITVGLRHGYERHGRIYDIEEAVRTAHRWMTERAARGAPFLSGMFTRGEVVYAWPRHEGEAGSDREPVAIFTGEAIPLYAGHLDDATVEMLLDELAAEIGQALGQEEVYVAYRDRTWILRARDLG